VPNGVDDEAKKAADAEATYVQKQREYLASILAERNRFIASKSEQSKSYDQTILTFSAGAIALSLTFVEKVAPTPICPGLLYTSWSAFGFAVISVIVSFIVSQEAFKNEITALDALWNAVNKRETTMPERVVNRHTTATRRLNMASGSLFVLGIVFLVLFGASNWPAAKDATKGTISPTSFKIEITGTTMPNNIPNVITTTGASIEIKKADVPTSALLAPMPQQATQAPAPAPTTTVTQTTTNK